MVEAVKPVAEWGAAAVEALGVAIIAGFAVYALVVGLSRMVRRDGADAMQHVRQPPARPDESSAGGVQSRASVRRSRSSARSTPTIAQASRSSARRRLSTRWLPSSRTKSSLR